MNTAQLSSCSHCGAVFLNWLYAADHEEECPRLVKMVPA